MNDLSNYAGLRPGWVLCQRENLWFAHFVQFLQHLALVLQIRNWKKTSTAPLHGRVFIRICLQHSQGDLFSSTASERTMTLTDSCCFHHLKWLPTLHLYIWCVFLLNPGVYMPLLIMFFQQYANWDLMEPILRSVLSLDLECVLLQMAATLVKQFVASGWMMYAWVLRQRSTAVLNFHVGVINYETVWNTWSWRYGYWNTRQRQQTRGPVCERICSTEKVIEEWNCSWDFADFGPFNEDMIDDINRCLLPLVHSNEKASTRHLYARDFIAYHSGGGRNKPASVSQPNICTHVIHSRKTKWPKRTLLSGFFKN